MDKNTTQASRLLTDAAESATNYLKGIYGPRSLKRIISAGVIVLSHLSPDEREQAMAAADNSQIEPLSNVNLMRNKLKEITKIEQQTPGTITQILSEKDSALADEIRKALGPESAQKKKAKGG